MTHQPNLFEVSHFKFLFLFLETLVIYIWIINKHQIHMKSNLLDQEAAKAAAKRLFQKVNFSGGALQTYEISSLLADTYEYLKIPFNPTSRDIKAYTQVLDANRDGQVTLADLETMALQYLCGPGILISQTFDSNVKKQKFEASGVSNTYTISNVNPQLQNNFTGASEQNKISSNQQKQAATSKYGSTSNNQAQYTEQTKQYISITKSIFQRHADQHFTITADRVPQLLSETYETLGRKGYFPSEQDVRVWMKLCDGNGDSHVEYEEYEYFVVRSLQRSGYQIYK